MESCGKGMQCIDNECRMELCSVCEEFGERGDEAGKEGGEEGRW